MKTQLISALLLIFLLVVSGCEEFTDTEPTTSISAEGMVYDQASAERVMNGVYSALQADNGGSIYGGYARMTDGVYADNIDHVGSYPDVAEIWGNDAISSNLFIENIWDGCYLVIYRANLLIDGLLKLEENDIDLEVRDALVAEAKFLRALMYFRLVNYFGGVPLITEPLADDLSNKDQPRGSVNEVYAQIKQDIADAEADIMDMGAPFRASMGAVMSLKAKVYLYTGEPATALSAASYFAYSGTSAIGDLAANYDDIFDESVPTSEDIFKILYTQTDGNNLAWFLYGPPGRGEVGASESLRNAFEPGDARSGMVGQIQNTWYVLKYSDVSGGADYPHVFRLADMYLVYAEALIRANSDYATASEYVNYVRNRAGLADVTLDAGNWEDIILLERRVELFAEGERWFDIKRFGVAADVISSKPSVTFSEVQNKYLLWPIPQDEIDANELISQGDQNPGY